MPSPVSTAVSTAIFRALLSLIFLVSGSTHLLRPDDVAHRLAAAPFGHVATAFAPRPILVVLAGVALLGGGLALLAGYRTRAAAALLIAVLVPITLTVQLGPASLGPLFKNVAILGGLIYFAVNGSPAISLDARQAAPALATLRRPHL